MRLAPAPRAIAEVAALTLLNTSWNGRRVQAVHGPADLTWSQVAEILTDEVGHPVRVERISDEAMGQGYLDVGMPSRDGGAVLGMSTGLRYGFFPEQPRSLVSTTPTGLRGWVRDHLRPAL